MTRKKSTTLLEDLSNNYFGYFLAASYSLIALVSLAALISYSPADPSFNSINNHLVIHNYLGAFGAYLADLLGQLFGCTAFVLPPLFIFLSIKFIYYNLAHRKHQLFLWLWIMLFLLSFSTFLSSINTNPVWNFNYFGGVLGAYIFSNLRLNIGTFFTALLSLLSSLFFFSLATDSHLYTWKNLMVICVGGIFRFLVLCIGKLLKLIAPMELYRRIYHGAINILNSHIFKVLRLNELFNRRASTLASTEYSSPNSNISDTPAIEPKPTTPKKKWFGLWSRPQSHTTGNEDTPTPEISEASALDIPESVDLDADIPQENPEEIWETTVDAPPLLPVEPHAKGNYHLPPLKFLKVPPKAQTQADIQQIYTQNGELKKVLDDYGIRGKMLESRAGPVVTLHEFEPAAGTKASRIIGLADDIARSMRAVSARIAIVNGKNAIGIELPNPQREMIYLRELLESRAFMDQGGGLPIILGKDIGGEPIIANLAKMPHLLVAGTTGSGKSVSINTMILSLLYRFSPEECKFIMVDPKMLELSVYDNIPHLLCPVVTEPKRAVVALKWVVKEMEDRYRAMSALGVRNINGYNDKIKGASSRGKRFTRKLQTGYNMETGEPVYEELQIDNKPLPYIVVIVDEMADLMLVAGKDIESSIQRLAQMARAAGIHLIMATQRPSVDVITGVIKANFPTRLSFQVTSKIDSRTIIGEQGAEQLLGQGDMLYMMGGGKLLRAHGPFVSDEEIETIVNYIKTQGEPQYIAAVTDIEDEGDFSGTVKSSGDQEEDLYRRAVSIVKTDGRTSISYVQRKLKIGYNKAAGLIERMEEEGILSSPDTSGKREIIG